MQNLDYSTENIPRTTKLWSREYGAGRLAQEVARAQEIASHRVSIALVRFDGLSLATDRLGYASDADMSQRVLGVLTGGVSAKDLVCRLGEDEFMLVLPERTESECLALVDRLRQRWARVSGTRDDSLEMSIGLASYPKQGSTGEALIAAADQAMYADKIGVGALLASEGFPGLHRSLEQAQSGAGAS